MTKKASKPKIRLTYNAPVSITFSLICALILILDLYLFKGHLISALFTAPGKGTAAQLAEQLANPLAVHYFDWKNPLDYLRLFTHVFGHSDWNHLLSNICYILLLGPILEDRYGSGILALMMTITALFTGVLNACFIPHALMGASGIAFMMILLASFGNVAKNEIPLTFILILVLYLSTELFSARKTEGIAVFAHIAGGLCGSLFGFLTPVKAKRAPKKDGPDQGAPLPPQPPRSPFAARKDKNEDSDATIVQG